MPRKLRGERYSEGVDQALIDVITNVLPYLSFEDAQDFYAESLPHLTDNEIALLGCNDRYFLLTGLLNRSDAIHPWLYDRCREVEARPDGYLDLWFRYGFKSSIITFAGTIQEVFIDPEIRIGIFSNTAAISRRFLSQIKEEFEGNEGLRQAYPDVLWDHPKIEAPSWSLQNGITVKRKGNPKEGSIEAHGLIEALPTGRHFPLLVYDDVINENSVTNPEQIKKATDRWELSQNLGVGESTRHWHIGTRYHFGDTYGVILDRGILKPRIYAATHDGTLNGRPVFFTQTHWDDLKKRQRGTVAAQMLQNPLAGEENVFRPQWLRPYYVRPLVMNVYIMVDPSLGRTKTSDRTAMAVIGVDTLGNRYLLDGFCHRMPLSQRWTNMRDLFKKWSGMPGVVLCQVGYERYGQQSDTEHFEEKMREEGPRFELIELSWTREGDQSKKARVSRLEPDFRDSSFFVPAKVWHRDFDGPAWWSVSEDTDMISYRRAQGETAQEKAAKARGEIWRCFEPIVRKDEDGNLYDLVRVFFEEFTFFPFSPRDDFVDAMSRLYDMEPLPPAIREELVVEDYADA